MFFTLSSGEPLTVQAPGTQTRSFCYVSDMVCKSFLFGLHFCGGFNLSAKWVLVLLLTQKTLFLMLKVDGLIRLMEGDNTGPINIGNPGYLYKIC